MNLINLIKFILCGLVSVLSNVHANEKVSEFRIREVRVDYDGEVDLPQVLQALNIREGSLYEESKVEEGLERLAEFGKFQGVRSFYNINTGTLYIDLRLVETLSGMDISVSEKEMTSSIKSDVSEVVGVSVGDPIYVDLFEEIRGRIVARLQDRGYLNAKVVLALEQREPTAMRRLIVSINLNQRIKVRAFKLSGFEDRDIVEFVSYLKEQTQIVQFMKNLRITDFLSTSKSMLNKSIGLSNRNNEGREVPINIPLDVISIRDSISKWGAEARQDGFYDFSVKSVPLDETLEGESVVVQVTLARGRRYNVQIENNVVFWERYLRSKVLDRTLRLGVPFSTTDAEALIKREYESVGYRDVKIKSSVTDTIKNRKIDFVIDEGKQYFLGVITLDGISDADGVDLNDVIREWVKPLESPVRRTYYDESLMKSRLGELLKSIRKKGFLKARILEFRPNFENDNRHVDVAISVQVGPKYFIRNVSVLGNTMLSERELDRLVSYEPGRAVDPDKLVDIAADIAQQYQSLGFPNVKVLDDERQSFIVRPESTDVDIQIRVEPGPQVTIGRFVVQGLKRTKEEVVVRELHEVGLRPGGNLRLSAVQEAEQRLSSLGIFSSTRFESVGGRVLEKGTSGGGIEKQEKDLRIIVNEQNAGAFEFGPGYRTELGLVGSAEFNYRNLGGLNRNVVIRAQGSRKLKDFEVYEQLYSATFLDPYILNDPTRVRFNVFYELDDQYVYGEKRDAQGNIVDPHAKTKGYIKSELSFGVAADRQLYEHFRVTQNIYTFSLPTIIDPVESGLQANYRIGTMGTTFTFDSRDNPFNPQQGNLLRASYEFSAPWIASDENAHFFIGRIIVGKYFLMPGGAVIATNFSTAGLFGFGDTPGVPAIKHFRLGGRSSIRSIKELELSSPPAGLLRQRSYEGKIEYRQPIFLDFGLSYFMDFGRIDARKYRDQPGLRYSTGWRSGIGLGLRYNTAVGPLVLDWAFNPDPKLGLGNDNMRVSFSIGTF